MLGLIGYADKLSVQPSQTIKFMVSAEDVDTYRADLVRLICGDSNPTGPGFKEAAVDTAVSGEYRGRKQEIHAGSCVVVPHGPAIERPDGFCVAAMIWPTTPDKGLQGLITKWSDDTKSGFGLVIDEGGSVALMLGDGEGRVEVHGTGKRLIARQWYFAAGELRCRRAGAFTSTKSHSSTTRSAMTRDGLRLPRALRLPTVRMLLW